MKPAPNPQTEDHVANGRREGAFLVFGLLCVGTLLGLAGNDLVLPVTPAIAEALGEPPAKGQIMVAVYVAGISVGLLCFGPLAGRYGRRNVLVIALVAYAVTSAACAAIETFETLVGLRLLQGFWSSAAGIFAAGIIRELFSTEEATRAIGLFGSLEAISPAGAPILGVWFFTVGGWNTAFWVIAAAISILALITFFKRKQIPDRPANARKGSFIALLRSRVYLRYCLSHALMMGSIMTIVYSASTVLVTTMDGRSIHFIYLQLTGIVCFIVAANLSGFVLSRFGAERYIRFGTNMGFVAAACLFLYAILGGNAIWALIAAYAVMLMGLGIRGPSGFLRAVLASRGDDDRGAALTILAITLAAAMGAGIMVPLVQFGLPALACVALLFQLASVSFLALPPLTEEETTSVPLQDPGKLAAGEGHFPAGDELGSGRRPQ